MSVEKQLIFLSMQNFQYTLEKYKGMNTRYDCPNCNHTKTFVRYVNTETGQHINPAVGKCDRESKCGYHYKPKQYFEVNKECNTGSSKFIPTPISQIHENSISCIPVNEFKQSLINGKTNNFLKYLQKLFGVDITIQLIKKYFIGTSNHWEGSTVFWQIDCENNIRTGKIMLYNHVTGKRVRKPFSHITWAHSQLKLSDEFRLKQCFFGEHLLKLEPNKTVAIVESEKTAIIASVYLPQFVWIAVGSLTNLTKERSQVLKGRNVILYPDLKGFARWSNKTKRIIPYSQIQGF